jgi:predicted RND superfamily exporter protein
MARAMRQCGKSLLYTALTTSAAFFLGAYSEYFGIQTFCYYAGTTVFANYLLQVNIFAPAIVLDARRRESRRWDLLCCVTSPRAERTVVPQDALEQGGQHVDEQDQPIAKGESKGEVDPAIAKYAPSETPTNAEDQAPSPMPSDKPVAAKTAYVRRAAEMSYLEYFFSELYYPVIAHPATRLFLFCGFCGLLIANIYGTFKVEQALDIAEVLPTDSFVREFIETARPLQLFAAEQSAPVEIILPDLPYHNQTVQEEIFRLQQAFLNVTEYNKGPMISWLTGYYMWVKAIPAPARPPLNAQGFSTREDKFYLSVKKFLSTAPGSRFKKDVIFMNSTDDGPTPIRIRMSRLTAFHNNVVGPLNTTYTMNHARRLIHEANFTAALPIANSTHSDAFIFSLPYIKAEGYKISVEQTFTIMIAALVGVAGVSLLVLKPHGLIVPAVAVITVAATYVNVIGNFPRWGWALDLNFITMLLITSTIALMVDYILHVLQHYHTQPFSTPPLERLKTCVTQIGPPIFMGCLTAWIAIIPMAFAKSFIFRAFFRVFFCVIAYSLGHALLLLPAILPTLSYLQLESCAANGGCGAAPAVKSASKEQELVPVDANAPQDDKSAAEVQPFATEEP